MGAITSAGKNYKPRPSTRAPITSAGRGYKEAAATPQQVASSPAVKGGYSAESYTQLSAAERAQVDQFYEEHQPLPKGIYSENASVGQKGGYTTKDVFEHPELVDTYQPKKATPPPPGTRSASEIVAERQALREQQRLEQQATRPEEKTVRERVNDAGAYLLRDAQERMRARNEDVDLLLRREAPVISEEAKQRSPFLKGFSETSHIQGIVDTGKGALSGVSKTLIQAYGGAEAVAGSVLFRASATNEQLREYNQGIVAKAVLLAPTLPSGIVSQVSTPYGRGELIGPALLFESVRVPKALQLEGETRALQATVGRVVTENPVRQTGLQVELSGLPVEGVTYNVRSTVVGGTGRVAGQELVPPGGVASGNAGYVPLGVRQTMVESRIQYGARQTIAPEELPSAYVATVKFARQEAVGPASGRPSSLPSTKSSLVSEPVTGEFSFVASPSRVEKLIPETVSDVSNPRIFDTPVKVYTEVVPAAKGVANTASVAKLEFVGIKRAGGSVVDEAVGLADDVPRQLGYEPPKVGSSYAAPGEIERVVPEPLFVGVNEASGTGVIVRATEFRKFLYGTGGIPGRPVITKGLLSPEEVKALKAIGGGKPFLVEKVKVIVQPTKPSPVARTVEVGSGGLFQVVLEQEPEQVKGELGSPTQETVKEAVSEPAHDVLEPRRPITFEKISSPMERLRDAALTSKSPLVGTMAGVAVGKGVHQSRGKQQGGQRTSQMTDQVTGQLFAKAVASDVGVMERLDVQQVQQYRYEPVSRLSPFQRESAEDEPRRRFPFLAGKKENAQLYDVRVRRSGVFKPVTTQGLRLNEAVRYAQEAVDTSAAASFMIVEHGTRTPARGVGRFLPTMQWRPSKRNPDVYVERNAYRINTGGEKLEIRPKRGRWRL